MDSDLHVELDVGNLCVLSAVRLKSPIDSNLDDDFLKGVATEGVQHLINAIYKLPSEYHKNIPVAKLPKPITAVPREKPIPKQKPLTRFQKIAQSKGIRCKKKEKMIWDDELKDFIPDYIHRRRKNEPDALSEETFSSMRRQKKERMAQNEYQRLRNIAENMNLKVTNLESVDSANKVQLSRSVAASKAATASLGKFQEGLKKEKPPKNSFKKRKFAPNVEKDLKYEKDNNLRILENLDKLTPKFDVQEGLTLYKHKSFPKLAKTSAKHGRKGSKVRKAYRNTKRRKQMKKK